MSPQKINCSILFMNNTNTRNAVTNTRSKLENLATIILINLIVTHSESISCLPPLLRLTH